MASDHDTSPMPPNSPPPLGGRHSELGWIQESLNKQDRRLDELDKRLQSVEKLMNRMIGGLIFVGVVLAVIQIALKLTEVSITFGPSPPPTP